MQSAQPRVLAESLFYRHLILAGDLSHYTGIVSLHGFARLAVLTGAPRLLARARELFAPFLAGKHSPRSNFPNYHCGGLGAAYLLHKGHLPEARDLVATHARLLLTEAPRDPAGIVCNPKAPASHQIWIDAAFAVSPFLLFAGLALDEECFVAEGLRQTILMVEALRDPANGLYHQAKNFNAPGFVTEDHWSRGNGWGAYALAELVAHCPPSFPGADRARALFAEHLAACAAVQNPEGLWHQEMVRPDSYVETSGSGFLLYALGVALAHGLSGDPAADRERFVRGLSGLLPYITDELDVHHTCFSCRAPGRGTVADYLAVPPVLNDPHAFGPLVLAFGQAAALGIQQLNRLTP